MTDAELDKIYNEINELLLAGKFLEVDTILKETDMTIGLDGLLGYLTITFAAKSKLKNRDEFFEKVLRLYPDEDPLMWYGLK